MMNWKVNDIGGVLRLALHYGIPVMALVLIAVGQAAAGLTGILLTIGIVGLMVFFAYRHTQQLATQHLARVPTQVVEVSPDTTGYVVMANDRELARLGSTEGELDGEAVTIRDEGQWIEIRGSDGNMLARANEESRAPGSRKWTVISPERKIELKPANWYFDSIWLGRSIGRPVSVCKPGTTLETVKGHTASQVADSLHPAEKVMISIVANRVHTDPTVK